MDTTFYDDTAIWKDRRGYDLSDRIWSNRRAQRAQIDAILREAIRNGDSVDDVATRLTRFINPTFAKPGDGKAHYAATRLAGNETRRAHARGTRQVSMADPAGGFLRFVLSAGHIEQDVCDTYANHDEGLGRGVYPARNCPLPPVHIGCRDYVAAVRWEDTGTPAAKGMSDFVEQLRVEYDLADPPDLSPSDLAIFRRETAAVRQAVQLMVRAWFEQTGLITTEQLAQVSPNVASWVADVRADKQRPRTVPRMMT